MAQDEIHMDGAKMLRLQTPEADIDHILQNFGSKFQFQFDE